ncbi:MAG: hypothetical protein ACFNVQ_07865 [Campylobacter sp.]
MPRAWNFSRTSKLKNFSRILKFCAARTDGNIKFCFKNGSRRFGELSSFKIYMNCDAASTVIHSAPAINEAHKDKILKFSPISELNFISRRAAS